MKPFKHVNAFTLDQAIQILREEEGLGKPIAGGTDLLGMLKDRILPVHPGTIINLKTIGDLAYIREEGEGVGIGALARLSEIIESPIVRKRCRLLADAAHCVASPQIRNLATIGGNLAQDVRCWYYRYPHQIGGRILCARKGNTDGEPVAGCSALLGENRYHSIFGAAKVCETPCTEQCPAGVDVPSCLGMIRERDLKAAARMLLDANPIPAITGRVCPQFCRERCNRSGWDDPVSTGNIERSLGDYILENGKEFMKPPEGSTGKRVAIVGSGPAGISAAFYLRRSGHEVVVLDRMKEPGGMLLHSIPSFRLPKDIVRRLVALLEGMGIQFRLDTQVGKDVALKELRRSFDRVFLATGAWALPSLGLEGEELTQQGLEFLVRAKNGILEAAGKKVLVIGGGNVAMDAAITALRQGARQVVLACLEDRKEMPALDQTVEKAVAEGVKLITSWGPSRILKAGGEVAGMELIRCVAVFDKDGHFAPQFDEAVREKIESDLIIMAAGQRPDVSLIDSESGMKVSQGLLVVDKISQATTARDVFGGGDLTSGPSTVVNAVAAGRRAALGINKSLGTQSRNEQAGGRGKGTLLTFSTQALKRTPPVAVSERPPEKRGLDQEDISGFSLSDIQREAERCLNCGCVAVGASDIAPVLMAMDATIRTTKRTVLASKFFSAGAGLLAHDELIMGVTIPALPEGARCGYTKFRMRNSIDFPIVSLATLFEMDSGTFRDARIVLGAVAPVPVRVAAAEEFLKGKTPCEEVAEEAAALAVKGAIPLSGNAYKVQVAKTLVKRAIMTAHSWVPAERCLSPQPATGTQRT
ncbi:MAG: FAD-dependent oxidoreductase [Thermodesulfobacteriota bacterium]